MKFCQSGFSWKQSIFWEDRYRCSSLILANIDTEWVLVLSNGVFIILTLPADRFCSAWNVRAFESKSWLFLLESESILDPSFRIYLRIIWLLRRFIMLRAKLWPPLQSSSSFFRASFAYTTRISSRYSSGSLFSALSRQKINSRFSIFSSWY